MSTPQQLQLQDTLTRTRQPITAGDGETLRFYCCGPTVYGPAHIGNFRTFLVQDLFRRVVELTGLPTRHVRNITDVDDKTIRQSQAEGKTLVDFTRHWTERLHADCAALNLLEPHLEPSAIGHIAEQIDLIEKLVAGGHAYQGADGSVYFKVSSFPEYGRLSGLQDRELKLGASASANDSDEYEKESLADFALWKARKPEDGENFWKSPWGEGRPGWHLECSAMSMKHLGESFDVHGGGVDLIFPHHENEIAQSEACTGKTFARHWFHSEHLMVEGEKMSKSLGNLFTLGDLQEKGISAPELRYSLLAGHYRQKLNFTLDSLHGARLNLQRIAAAVARLSAQLGGRSLAGYEELVELARSGKGTISDGPFAEVWGALLDDLNTPRALGAFFSALRKIEKEELDEAAAGAALDGIAWIAAAFGWEIPPVEGGGGGEEVPEEVRALAEKRWAAKQAKDWAASDALRVEITALGWQIKDGKEDYAITRVE
jgi:cysteinyl-tRNA synthetase